MIKVVEVDVSDLVRAFKRLKIDVRHVEPVALTAAAQVIQQPANAAAPGPHVEIGPVEKSGDGHQVEIGPDDDHWYYRFAETGVVAHRISATNARVLRMGPTGGAFFRRYAQHPGHVARPFLRPAFDQHSDRAADAYGDEVKKVLSR